MFLALVLGPIITLPWTDNMFSTVSLFFVLKSARFCSRTFALDHYCYLNSPEQPSDTS